MRRLMTGLVIAALALPVAVLGAMVGDAERTIAKAPVMRVAIRGYDPRDMLRGHYLRYQFDWNAEIPFIGRVVRLCVLSAPADAPARVRPLAPGSQPGADCVLVVDGWGETLAEARRAESQGDVPGRLQFTPDGIGSGRLYVPERHAARLETLLREGRVRLTIDVAVPAVGSPRIKAWHIDGKTVDAYFAQEGKQ